MNRSKPVALPVALHTPVGYRKSGSRIVRKPLLTCYFSCRADRI